MNADRNTPAAIEVRNLTKTFKAGRRHNVLALDNVSLSVPTGSCLAVVGESGSGKTTLARIVVGLESADSGSVLLDSVPVLARASRRERHRRAGHIQMVFQDPQGSLNRRLPVRVAVEEVLRAHFPMGANERRNRCLELFDQVGLSSSLLNSLPSELSGGQRQRIAIARALAALPSVIVLDEAVAALDVSVQAQILNLLAELRRSEGLSYLFISHDLSVVRQVADEIVVMRRGSIVEQGPVAQILDHPHEPYTRLLRECAPRAGWVPRRELIEQLAKEAER